MQPHKASIHELFSTRKQYAVPLFQRRYVWSRDRQWEPLWDDLAGRAESLLSSDAAAPKRSHFLGAIVTVPLTRYGLRVPAAELIDGQQRLTTLQILLTAMADVFREYEHADLAAALDDLVRNRKPLTAAEDGFKLWPTNQDRKVFKDVMEAGGHEELDRRYPLERRRYARRPEPRPRLVEAYQYFDEAISGWLDADEAQGVERATALYTAITTNFHLVHIELEPGEDPQDIFEALNGRNEPLLPSDLIKNFIFRQAGERSEALHDAYWRPLDERKVDPKIEGDAKRTDDGFWSQSQRQGRFNRSRLDLFLFHYTVMSTVHEVVISDLFREFQDWWHKTPRDVERELAALRDHASVFGELLVPTDNSVVGRFARRLRALDTTAAYPLVLFLLGRGRDRVQDLDEILVAIESYLVRRAVCGLTTKNYNLVFLGVLKRVSEREVIDGATFRAELGASKEDSARWPDDNEFRRAWVEGDAYARLQPGRTRMVLEALEAAVAPTHAIRVEIKSALTVEHVMPRAWRHKWPLPAGGTPEDEGRRDRLIHAFGNLTLLTGPLNSSLQDAAFEDRRPEIAKRALLNLNIVFQDPNLIWDEKAILDRGAKLYETARQIWPRSVAI